MTLHGSCHCGALSFDCDVEPERAMTCNCSICRRKGAVLHFVDGPQVRLTAAPDALGSYRFHRHIITHHFCKTCGIAPWSRVDLPDGTSKVALNLRASDIPFAHLPLTEFDGAAL
ncbi:MAG: GFA family protein [Tabrizicola sp.]